MEISSDSLVPCRATASNAGGAARAARMVTLAPGEYWRAVVDLDGYLDSSMGTAGLRPSSHVGAAAIVRAGTLLVLVSVHVHEGEAHSITLHPHPASPDETQRRMLVGDFLGCFEHVDQRAARAERQAEMQALAAKAQEMAEDLSGVWQDPARATSAMREGLALLSARTAASAAAPDSCALIAAPAAPPDGRIEPQSAGGVVAALVASGGEQGSMLAEMRARALSNGRAAEGMQLWLNARHEALRQAHAAIIPFHREVSVALMASTERALAFSGQIRTALATVGVYCGEGVEVEAIARGASAPADLRLHLFQARGYCDEDLSVFADTDETWGYENLKEFDDALRTQPAFLEQVFSGCQRAVMLMSVTRRYRGGLSENESEADRRSFVLVRDGQNVFRVRSSIATHTDGDTDRLFPTLNEASQAFVGIDGQHVTLESLGFSDASERFEQRSRHYRRFLYLLCGLDHREGLFGDFYPAELKLSDAFLSLEFQASYLRFVFDADPATQLPDGRPSLAEWLREQNRMIQSGSRVLCHWRTAMTPETAPAVVRPGSLRWEGFEWLYEPVTKAEIAIAYRDGERLKVACRVQGRRGYRSSQPGDRVFDARVDLTPALVWENDFRGFLCLDAAKSADLAWYLGSRTAREGFVRYVRLFKAGIAFLRSEEAAEAGTRTKLSHELRSAGLAQTEEQAQDLVDEAVIAWRAARRGEALPCYKDGQPLPVGWSQLCASLWTLARRGGETAALADACVALAAAAGRQPLRLVSSGRTGSLVLYCAPSAAERCDDLEVETCVVRMRLQRRRQKPLGVEDETWAPLLGVIAKEIVLKEWPEAEKWILTLPPVLPREARIAATERCRSFHADCARFLQPVNAATWRTWFAAYKDLVETKSKKRVSIPSIAVPFACVHMPNGSRPGAPWFLAVSLSACSWLQLVAPSPAEAVVVKEWTTQLYADRSWARARHAADEALSSFSVAMIWSKSRSLPGGPILGEVTGRYGWQDSDPTPEATFERMQKEIAAREGGRGRAVWAPPGLLEPGACLGTLTSVVAALLKHAGRVRAGDCDGRGAAAQTDVV